MCLTFLSTNSVFTVCFFVPPVLLAVMLPPGGVFSTSDKIETLPSSLPSDSAMGKKKREVNKPAKWRRKRMAIKSTLATLF